jgi:hypothetical protein
LPAATSRVVRRGGRRRKSRPRPKKACADEQIMHLAAIVFIILQQQRFLCKHFLKNFGMGREHLANKINCFLRLAFVVIIISRPSMGVI